MNVSAKGPTAKSSVNSSLSRGQLVTAKGSVCAAQANVGISKTPLKAGVKVASADAKGGVGWQYTGAEAGASLYEAHAGPLEARAGFKVGASFTNGIPKIDGGIVSLDLNALKFW